MPCTRIRKIRIQTGSRRHKNTFTRRLGKTKTASDIARSVKYVNTDLTLKKKHSYYAQIQLGMAILNIKTTDFIVYASFDESFLLIEVDFDLEFTSDMLISLKATYYNEMLHHVCIQEGNAE